MRYNIKIDDERQLIVKALYDWRNELPTDSLLRPDLEQLILKIIDTPEAEECALSNDSQTTCMTGEKM